MIDLLLYTWGFNPSSFAMLQQSDICDLLTVSNELSQSVPDKLEFKLGPHTVLVEHGGGVAPDKFFIVPGYGYTVDEDEFILNEHTKKSIKICKIPLG